MKKRRIICLVVCIIMFVIMITGCNNNKADRYNNGYEIAEYDKFNSYASDNGLDGTKISIQGTVKSVIDYSEMSECSIVTEMGERWLCAFLNIQYAEELDELLDEEFITVYGVYTGYSDVFLMPVIYADRIIVNGKEYYPEDLSFRQKETELETESPTAALATELPTEKVEQVMYDDNEIVITYKGIEKNLSETKIKILIENNSNKDYCIQTRNMSVNGFMLEPIFSPDVTAGNKVNDAFTFHNSSLKENDIAEINRLEFNFYIFNWNDVKEDRNSAVETEKIHIDI